MKKVVFVMVLLATSLVVGNVSAAVVTLSDATLMQFTDQAWVQGCTLNSMDDIAGNPGVQYNMTWAGFSPYGESYCLLALSGQALTDSGVLGNTWSIQFDNPDTGGYYDLAPKNATLAYFSPTLDDWIFAGHTAWFYNYLEPMTFTFAIPANATMIGMKLSSSDWATHPTSARVQVVPEPATLILLGLGGLSMLRRKRA
jgi:hypothetical protein